MAIKKMQNIRSETPIQTYIKHLRIGGGVLSCTRFCL